MTLAADLRAIVAAARPTIVEWIDIGEQFTGLREACKAKGLDWGQIKGLIKAQVLDERDNGNRVAKIVEKADFASSYAAMLGLLPDEMNNKNYSVSVSALPIVTAAPDLAAEESVGTDTSLAPTAPVPEATEPRADTRTAARGNPSDDDEGIPTWLQRGHPDCVVREQGRG